MLLVGWIYISMRALVTYIGNWIGGWWFRSIWVAAYESTFLLEIDIFVGR